TVYRIQEQLFHSPFPSSSGPLTPAGGGAADGFGAARTLSFALGEAPAGAARRRAEKRGTVLAASRKERHLPFRSTIPVVREISPERGGRCRAHQRFRSEKG